MFNDFHKCAYHEAGHCVVGNAVAPSVIRARVANVGGLWDGTAEIPGSAEAAPVHRCAVAVAGVLAEARYASMSIVTLDVSVGKELFRRLESAILIMLEHDLHVTQLKVPMQYGNRLYDSPVVNLTREDVSHISDVLFDDEGFGFKQGVRLAARHINSNESWQVISGLAASLMDNAGQWIEDPFHLLH